MLSLRSQVAILFFSLFIFGIHVYLVLWAAMVLNMVRRYGLNVSNWE